MTKKEKIATSLVTIIVGYTIIGKLFQQQQVMEQMQSLGLNGKLQILAIIETVALLLYIFPKSNKVGFLLLTAYYGGAIAVNLNNLPNTIPAIIFITLIWIGTYFKNPYIFKNEK